MSVGSSSPQPSTQSLDSLRSQLSKLKSHKSNLIHNLNQIKSHKSNLSLIDNSSPNPTQSDDPILTKLSQTLKLQEDLLTSYRHSGITVFEFDLNVGRRQREEFKLNRMEQHGLDYRDQEEVGDWLDGLLNRSEESQGVTGQTDGGIGKREKKGLGIGVRLETFHNGQFQTPYYLLFSNSSSTAMSDSDPNSVSRASIQSSTISTPSSNQNQISKVTRLNLVRHTLPHFLPLSEIIGKHFGNGKRSREDLEEGEVDGGGLNLLKRLKHPKMEAFLHEIHQRLSNQTSRSEQLFSLIPISSKLPGSSTTTSFDIQGNEVANDLLNLAFDNQLKNEESTNQEKEKEKGNLVSLETYANESFDKILIKWNLPSRILFGNDGKLKGDFEEILKRSQDETVDQDQDESGDGGEVDPSEEKSRKRKGKGKEINLDDGEREKILDLIGEERLTLEIEISFGGDNDRMSIDSKEIKIKGERDDEEESSAQDSEDDDDDGDQDEPRPDNSEPSSSSSKKRKSKRKETKDSHKKGMVEDQEKGQVIIYLKRNPPLSSNLNLLLDSESQSSQSDSGSKRNKNKKRKRKEIKLDYEKLLEIRREELKRLTMLGNRKERRGDLEKVFFEIVGDHDDQEEEDGERERIDQRKGQSRDLDLNVEKVCWLVWRELKGEERRKR